MADNNSRLSVPELPFLGFDAEDAVSFEPMLRLYGLCEVRAASGNFSAFFEDRGSDPLFSGEFRQEQSLPFLGVLAVAFFNGRCDENFCQVAWA